jgi:two-component system chemotaxis sensor kinase CheA
MEIVMQEKEKYLEASRKIESYMSASVHLNKNSLLVENLARACEKAAQSEGKEVKFITHLDESVLENAPRRQIKEMLTQLVRNSVAHGIESPEERIALGKERTGYIRLSIKWENNLICVKLSDDGAGIDFEKIRKKALRLKLFSEEDVKTMDRDKLLHLIFSPGFSTADSVSMISGRGVGLDLVQDRIRELKGSIRIKTKKDTGTVFCLYISPEVHNQNSVVPGDVKFPKEAKRVP